MSPVTILDGELVQEPPLVAGEPLSTGLTLAELKRHIDKELCADDPLLEQYLVAAFEQAQAPPPYGCGRLLLPDPFDDASDPAERSFQVPGHRTLVPVPDARELASVTVGGTAVSAYTTVLRNGLIVALSLSVAPSTTEATSVVELVGRFGFASIPMNLREAIYILAARSFYERNAQFADQVALGEGGGVQAYYRQLPPRTKVTFASFAPPTGYVGLA